MPEAAPHTVSPNPSPAQPLRLEAESLWQNPTVPELRGQGELSVDERNAWLDRTLNGDPARPLPEVHLLQDKVWTPDIDERHAQATSFQVNSPGDKSVGYVILNRPIEPAFYGGSDKHFIRIIKIFDKARGQGYGPATYLSILKSLPASAGLRTEGVMNEDSKKVWDNLVSKGVARQTGSEERPPTAYETVF
jgi:hypothetical protein